MELWTPAITKDLGMREGLNQQTAENEDFRLISNRERAAAPRAVSNVESGEGSQMNGEQQTKLSTASTGIWGQNKGRGLDITADRPIEGPVHTSSNSQHGLTQPPLVNGNCKINPGKGILNIGELWTESS